MALAERGLTGPVSRNGYLPVDLGEPNPRYSFRLERSSTISPILSRSPPESPKPKIRMLIWSQMLKLTLRVDWEM